MTATSNDRPIRPLVHTLIKALTLDVWPSHATLMDFGIQTPAHYAAIQKAVLATPDLDALRRELNEILGSGPKITAWVRQRVPDAPVFVTAWDDLPLGDEEPADGGAE
ncbi:hypothetical protein EKD04_017300 [Chloroflexales bacterium ZM16-3]|nr:hypothetical protein [Chloroflexales bacterium ZM16-3]